MKISPIFSKGLFLLLALLCLTPFISSPFALLMGFIFSLIFGNPFEKQSARAVNFLLKISVVGLGFGMHITETMKTSQDAFALTATTIVITLILGVLLGKLFKLDHKIAYLISCGTAICGGSAIAAVSPIINAGEKQISISLVVVMLLNAIALFIFPSIATFLELSQVQFGLWSAIAIHDTSSVVGAALVYGDEALRIATTVKLGRALWIVPVSIFSLIFFASKNKKFSFPWFIILFILAVLCNSYLAFPETLGANITLASKRMLVLCLFLIGAGISIKGLKESGIKPIFLGVLLWAIISMASFISVWLWY